MSRRMVCRELMETAGPYLQALFHVFESREATLGTSQQDRILTRMASVTERELLQVLSQRHNRDNDISSCNAAILNQDGQGNAQENDRKVHSTSKLNVYASIMLRDFVSPDMRREGTIYAHYLFGSSGSLKTLCWNIY